MLSVMIVDDEPLAREELRLMLEEYDDVDIVAEAANAVEALPAVHRLRPDVLFLDIEMPRISGLELVSMLDPEKMPQIVFITAFDEFALRAFEERALDYLLKPVSAERLERTLQRLRQGQSTTQQTVGVGMPLRSIPCIGHNRILLMPLADVEFVHSELAGNKVVTGSGQGITKLTLRTLEEKTGFLRCHRQVLINPDQIAELLLLDGGVAEAVTRSGHKVQVSRRYLKPLKEQLSID